MMRFSCTVRLGNTRRPSGTSAMPIPTRLCVAYWSIGCAVEEDVARSVGRCRPAMVRSSVDLPPPLAPMQAKILPSSTLNEIMKRAWKSP